VREAPEGEGTIGEHNVYDVVRAVSRYRVVFTPAGWQVIDTEIARDPVYEFGLGADEHHRAKERCDSLNEDYRMHGPLWLRGEA
jgi:hypothetical protein